MAEDHRNYILDARDADTLKSLGWLKDVSDASKELLLLHEDVLFRTTPMTQTFGSIHTRDSNSDSTFLKVPAMEHSLEAFKFLGLRPEMAQFLWNAWTNRGGDPTDFYRFPFEVIFGACDRNGNSSNDGEWIGSMKSIFSEEFIAAIMDESFKDLRLTDSLLKWVWDTVQRRWAILESIRDCSKARTKESHLNPYSEASEDEGNTIVASFAEQGGTDIVSRRVIDESSSVTLWKGTSHPLASQYFEWNKRVYLFADTSNETPDMQFRWNHCISFSPQKELAILTANFAMRRCLNLRNTWRLVSLNIPSTFIERLQPAQLSGTLTWKQLVWNSRRRVYEEELPEDIATYVGDKEFPLVIGDICKAGVDPIHKLSGWTEMTADNTLAVQINGVYQNAIQYVFQGVDTIKDLRDCVKITIHHREDSNKH